MNVSAEDFERYYASLSDYGLSTIDRDDLTEIARECYDRELAKRGITAVPALVPEVLQEHTPKEELAEVATFGSVHEAQLAQAVLRSAEIPATIADDRTHLSSEVRLMVPAELLDQAHEVLGSEISEEDLIAQAEAAAPPPEEES